MIELIYNYNKLEDKDITEKIVRIKVLLINDNNLLIGNALNVYQFPGGHLEANETFNDCLKREILEETGIELSDDELTEPYFKISYLSKDWPEKNKNRKDEIYYYVINTNKLPNLEKINLTENEKEHNFKLESIPLDNAIKIIQDNIPNNPKNRVISRDMIIALSLYLNK